MEQLTVNSQADVFLLLSGDVDGGTHVGPAVLPSSAQHFQTSSVHDVVCCTVHVRHALAVPRPRDLGLRVAVHDVADETDRTALGDRVVGGRVGDTRRHCRQHTAHVMTSQIRHDQQQMFIYQVPNFIRTFSISIFFGYGCEKFRVNLLYCE